MSALPIELDGLTPSWLSEVLEAEVTGFEMTVIGTGQGFVGQVARLQLQGEPSLPSTVVVKLPTVDPGGRAMGVMLRLWQREHHFYTELAEVVGVRVPRAYASLEGVGTTGELTWALVMEDLAPLQAADQVAGADDDRARRVIDELAALHATWWDQPRLAEFSWLPGLDDPMTGSVLPMFEAGWGQFRARYEQRVAARTLGWAEAFAPRVPALLERYLSEPNTLTHGDFRLDNMFFGPDGQFALVDWQMSMRSPGGSDLVYFLATNLQHDTRQRMERELVERYCQGLAAHGVRSSYATFDRIWQGYIEGLLFYTVSYGGGLLTIDPGNQRGLDLFDAMVLRIYTAADELDAGSILD